MASPLDEVRRLREELADVIAERDLYKAERDEAKAGHTELAALTQRYVGLVSPSDERPEDEVQLARYQQGWMACERHIDGLHRDGAAHDQHGRMVVITPPKELPEPKTTEELLAEAEAEQQREAQWWFDQFGRERAAERDAQKTREDQAELLRYRAANAHDRERAS